MRRIGQGQRGNREFVLAGQAERDAARHQYASRRGQAATRGAGGGVPPLEGVHRERKLLAA